MILWLMGGALIPWLGSGACVYAVCTMTEEGNTAVDAGGVNLESHPLNL
jgi:hypothetical protein